MQCLSIPILLLIFSLLGTAEEAKNIRIISCILPIYPEQTATEHQTNPLSRHTDRFSQLCKGWPLTSTDLTILSKVYKHSSLTDSNPWECCFRTRDFLHSWLFLWIRGTADFENIGRLKLRLGLPLFIILVLHNHDTGEESGKEMAQTEH